MEIDTVGTIAGTFDRTRLDKLKRTIKGLEHDEEVMFEGLPLSVGLGVEIADFAEQQFSNRNAGL